MTNNLIKRVLSAGKKTMRTLGLAGSLTASAMLPFITGCGDTGGSGGGDEPLDSPVVWTGEYATSATENSAFSSGGASAFDPDGYPLEYTKIAGPAFLNVHPIFGTLYGTPTDADVGANQQVIIRATDGTMPTDKTFYMNVGNVADVTGIVTEIGSGVPLVGAEVKLGANTTYTGSSGDYAFTDIPDGDYSLVTRKPSTHVTYKQGTLQINQAREHASKLLNLETSLIPEAHFQFVEDCARSPPSIAPTNNAVIKWNQKPVYDIYTIEVKDNVAVNPAKVTIVTDTIKNKISGNFYDSSGNLLTFSDSDINLIPTLPPVGQPADGHIKVRWDNNYGGGANGSWLNGNEIISASARANTGLGEDLWIQELTENMIAEGETNDAAYIDSVLYDPVQPSNITYSAHDNIWIDFHKNRKIGNKSNYSITFDLDDRDVSTDYIDP